MSIDKATVSRVAELARLKLQENELEPIAKDLGSVLEWINTLNEVNTDGIEPLANINGQELPLREDKVSDGNYPEKILKNAPQESSGFFVVPKVVE